MMEFVKKNVFFSNHFKRIQLKIECERWKLCRKRDWDSAGVSWPRVVHRTLFYALFLPETFEMTENDTQSVYLCVCYLEILTFQHNMPALIFYVIEWTILHDRPALDCELTILHRISISGKGVTVNCARIEHCIHQILARPMVDVFNTNIGL